MDKYWVEYLERYVNDAFHWYQPKWLTIKPANLVRIQGLVALLKKWEGKNWRKCQPSYARAMLKEGLAGRGTSGSANARMCREILDSLGLAWITDTSIIEITAAGEKYIQGRHSHLQEIVAKQLR